MLYFSYGSFLDSETLKRYAPHTRFISRAILHHFEVQFNFLSKTYDGGVTSVEPASGKKALGVLYDVSLDEIKKLDIVEGVPAGIYYRETVPSHQSPQEGDHRHQHPEPAKSPIHQDIKK